MSEADEFDELDNHTSRRMVTEYLMLNPSQARKKALGYAAKVETIITEGRDRDLRGASATELAEAQVYASLSTTWATMFAVMDTRQHRQWAAQHNRVATDDDGR